MILEAAKRLFLKQGIDNVSMRRIAAEAGYSPAAIYRYFRNKREILSHLRNQGFAEYHERQKRMEPVGTSGEMMYQGGMNYLQFAVDHPDDFHLMFCTTCEEVDLEGKLAEESMRSFHFFRKRMEKIIESGYFGDADPETVVFAYWAGVHGLASLVNSGRFKGFTKDLDQEELIKKIVRFLGRPGCEENSDRG